MGQGVEHQRITVRALARDVLARWGIRVRFGHRAENGHTHGGAAMQRPAMPPAMPPPPPEVENAPRTAGSVLADTEIRGIFSHSEPAAVVARAEPWSVPHDVEAH